MIVVTKITVIRSIHNADVVYLHTTLPEAQWPFEGTVTLRLPIANGLVEEYCSKHFAGIPITVIPG